MSSDENGQSWQERLMLACTAMAHTGSQEEEIFRQEAKKAPLMELSTFLDSPLGKYDGHARAVMREVLREREAEVVKRASRKDWWLKLLQQGLAQFIAGLLVGAVIGYIF